MALPWATRIRAGVTPAASTPAAANLSTSASAIEQMQCELRRRLLKALHIDECRGHRLVSRKEMLQNLQA